MGRRRFYTDAQYRWLWQKYLEGYTIPQLCDFAFTHRNTLDYHFRRLGLRVCVRTLPPLDREEFDALADDREE